MWWRRRVTCERLARQVEAVRALHHPEVRWTRGRPNGHCAEDHYLWPCPTARALDNVDA
jgi:hypothetical protein